MLLWFDYQNVADELNRDQKESITNWVKALCELSYQQRLKIYIPGENAVNDKRRLSASEFGVVIVLKCFEKLFKDIPSLTETIKSTLSKMDIYDYETQLHIMSTLKSKLIESK